MKVAIACDHGGFPLKDALIEHLKKRGDEVLDFGTDSEMSVDFPDFAEKACQAILDGKAERGILICGSGVGMCLAANKIKGILASVCHDIYSAHQGVEHDNLNVLCLGARVIGSALANDLADGFLNARFSNEERMRRRIEKLHKIELKY